MGYWYTQFDAQQLAHATEWFLKNFAIVLRKYMDNFPCVWHDPSWKHVDSPLELILQKQPLLGQATQLYVLQVPPEVQTSPAEVEVIILNTEDREIKDSAGGAKWDVTHFECCTGKVVVLFFANDDDVEVEFLIWDVGEVQTTMQHICSSGN